MIKGSVRFIFTTLDREVERDWKILALALLTFGRDFIGTKRMMPVACLLTVVGVATDLGDILQIQWGYQSHSNTQSRTH